MSEKPSETPTPQPDEARRRRRFRTAELTDAEVERIAASRMDARHDRLNALLDLKSEGR